MKKTIGIAIISLTLASCGSTKYNTCSNNSQQNVDSYYQTEAIHENLTQNELQELIACENCDEID